MGLQKFRNAGKSQWVLVTINPMIFTRTRRAEELTAQTNALFVELAAGAAASGPLTGWRLRAVRRPLRVLFWRPF
jgi:hypothetical protein